MLHSQSSVAGQTGGAHRSLASAAPIAGKSVRQCQSCPRSPSFESASSSFNRTLPPLHTSKQQNIYPLLIEKPFFYLEKVCDGTKMTLSEGIVKINSRVLDSSELKRYDKLEKEGISYVGSTQKGKDIDR